MLISVQEAAEAKVRAQAARAGVIAADPLLTARTRLSDELAKALAGNKNEYGKAASAYMNLKYQQGLQEYRERNKVQHDNH